MVAQLDCKLVEDLASKKVLRWAAQLVLMLVTRLAEQLVERLVGC
jgi:hypothetical protein